MPNRLEQIVAVTALAAGATTAVAVGLSNNNVALIADVLERDNPNFEVVSCTATLLTVKNNGAAVGNCNFLLTYWCTPQRVFGSNATQQLSPAPFVVGGSAGTGVADASSLVLQFQPGGTGTGPVVFNSFADLYAELVSLRTANGGGKYAIGYDSSLAAVTVPAGTYNLTNVDQIGLGGRQVAISYADGTVFTGARKWKDLLVTNLNTTTAPITDPVNDDQFVLDNTVWQTTTGINIAMVAYTLNGGGNTNVTVWLTEGSAIGGSETGRVFATNGSNQLRLKLDSSSSIAVPAAVQSTGGTPVLVVTAPSMKQVPGLFSNWGVATGYTTPGPTQTTPASLRPNPYDAAPATAAIATAAMGQWLRGNSAGGTFVQDLPAIGGATFTAPGTFLLITDPGNGGTPIEVNPAGTDTINGSTNSQFVPGAGAMLLVPNGRSAAASDWSIVGVYGADRVMAPDMWFRDNIAAADAGSVLTTRLSTFNQWQTSRAGSCTGLAVRLSALVTQGTITVTVTVGGAPTALSVVITAGNQGANLTLPAGTVNFTAAVAAGIGMSIATSADLLPAGTNDLEATLECAMNGLAA